MKITTAALLLSSTVASQVINATTSSLELTSSTATTSSLTLVGSTSTVSEATSSPTSKADPYPIVNLLKVDRDAGRLTYIPHTVEQKNIVLTNIENALQMWVNYYSKLEHHGAMTDPFPKIKRLRDNISTISNDEFFSSIKNASIQMRDSHSGISSPPPYSCFFTTTGLNFQLVEGSKDIVNEPVVIVTSRSTDPVELKLFGPDYSKISSGDFLHSLDGLSFAKWFDKYQSILGLGANVFAGHRYALDALNGVGGKYQALPTNNEITFQFKSSKDGTIYTVVVPHLSIHSEDCWAVSSNLYKNLTGVTLPGTPAPPVSSTEVAGLTKRSDILSGAVMASKDQHGGMSLYDGGNKPEYFPNTLFKRETPLDAAGAPFVLNQTDIVSVSWGVWMPNSQNLGIIRLDNFIPVLNSTGQLDIPASIKVIRDLLTNELKDTNSLLIDLRGNYGGNYIYMSLLGQLFKGDGKAMPLIMLKNNMTFNVRIRPADPHDSFVKAWYATSPQSRYSGLALHRDDSEFHLIGQAYFRPMAVLTNGRCYSACDGFASVVQDNALGTVFGEDGLTGGGGGGPVQLDPLMVALDPEHFTRMPFTDELTTKNGKYSMQISISFATLVRTGLYDGQWVEDIGIKTEVVVRARISDIVSNPAVNSQYDRISKHLDDVGKSTGKRDLYFISEPQNYKISAGQLSVDAEIAGMDYISVQNENLGTDISVQEISTSRKHVSLFSNYTFASLGNHHLVVTGKAKGKQVLKTYRSVSIVPKVEDRHNLASSPFVFNGPSKSVGIYNDRRAISKGEWNNKLGKWVVGDGVSYKAGLESSIELFFTLPVGSNITISIDAKLESTRENDMLYLSVKSDGGVETQLLRSPSIYAFGLIDGLSGNVSVPQSVSYTTLSQEFSVSLMFSSNAGGYAGPVLNALSVQVSA
ncbi:hypothetical protein BASA50_011033 [Batrachochytrium salamandrivorans]|uniref:Tail specific protease domain-containing protein n=1 Tax=Batrachochytrium salamandrivorans TaxID=1357716 RepID=A0ABQ8EXX5_9FUNG|nr:hypothetical protein BASA60_005776 [Batrachochytrium salamandrivorans]KAH6587941.1 hypothetical protein BASA50_011033 [Batrachochytrium salamandrivorans]